MEPWVDTELAETQLSKAHHVHFQLEALSSEHLWLVKGLYCTLIWALTGNPAQSQVTPFEGLWFYIFN